MVKMCYGHGCQSNDLLAMAMAKLQNLLRSVCINGQICLDQEQIEMVDMAKVAIPELIPKVIGTYVSIHKINSIDLINIEYISYEF